MTRRITEPSVERRRAREQQRLLERWRLRGDREARTRLILRTLPLVRHVARRFRASGEEQADLVQSGTEGLIKAVDGYEPERGTSFATYAVPKIAGEIKHHLRDNSWDVHVPRPLRERSLRVGVASARLAGRLGRPPRPAELAAEAGVDEAEATEALLAGAAYCAESLQASAADGVALEDTIPSRDVELDGADDRLALTASMRALPVREREVLALRFWGDMSQREIASEVGVSQIQVSRLLRGALDHLRLELLHGRSTRRRVARGRAGTPTVHPPEHARPLPDQGRPENPAVSPER